MKRNYIIIAWMGVIAIFLNTGENVLSAPLKECSLVVRQDKAIMPSIEVRSFHGGSITLGGARKKALLLNFWASWCPPCIRELPALHGLMVQLVKRDVAIEWFAISEDDESQAEFLAKINLDDLPVIYDDFFRIAKNFGVSRLPVTLLLNGKGELLWRYDGACAWDDDQLIETIEQHILGSP